MKRSHRKEMTNKSDPPSSSAKTLNGYGILDTPNEIEFDRLVREAAASLGAPIALISLLDENRQWFKAKVGLVPSETPLAISFCTHAVRGKDVFVVEDTTRDPRFADNPLVTGDPKIRFYAGAPLTTPNGARIGTICVIDTKPHAALDDFQKAQLERLAAKTITIMEERKSQNIARLMGGKDKP